MIQGSFPTLLKKYRAEITKYKAEPGKEFNQLRLAAKAAHNAGDLTAFYELACFFDDIDDPVNAYLFYMHVPSSSPHYADAQRWIDSVAVQDEKLAQKVASDRLLMQHQEPVPLLVFSRTQSKELKNPADQEQLPAKMSAKEKKGL